MQLTALKGFVHACFSDLLGIVFPNPCLCCTSDARMRNASFCSTCVVDLPYTDHFSDADNVVRRHFSGRLPLVYGAAVVYFRRGGHVQSMLHRFKYKKQREIGDVFGQIAAENWVGQGWQLPDVVIPIPIHKKKQWVRGYNQSAVFGTSFAQAAGIHCADRAIVKPVQTASQTGKSRDDRIRNVQDVFVVDQPHWIAGKHILLVDDVVTTGATIEACGQVLLAHGAAQLSVLVLAAAK
jgi:ComF family protein